MTVSEASTLFPCSSSFQSFKSLQRYLNYGQCENKTNQESVYYQLLCDWVARFITLLPENRPRAKSGVSSVTSSSLPLWGWALQRPRAGGTGCSSYVKVYLKARFDAREELRCKADPEQFAIDTRNARKKDPGNPGGGGFSQKNWVGVCDPASQNPYPIYDQNLRYSLPYL